MALAREIYQRIFTSLFPPPDRSPHCTSARIVSSCGHSPYGRHAKTLHAPDCVACLDQGELCLPKVWDVPVNEVCEYCRNPVAMEEGAREEILRRFEQVVEGSDGQVVVPRDFGVRFQTMLQEGGQATLLSEMQTLSLGTRENPVDLTDGAEDEVDIRNLPAAVKQEAESPREGEAISKEAEMTRPEEGRLVLSRVQERALALCDAQKLEHDQLLLMKQQLQDELSRLREREYEALKRVGTADPGCWEVMDRRAEERMTMAEEEMRKRFVQRRGQGKERLRKIEEVLDEFFKEEEIERAKEAEIKRAEEERVREEARQRSEAEKLRKAETAKVKRAEIERKEDRKRKREAEEAAEQQEKEERRERREQLQADWYFRARFQKMNWQTDETRAQAYLQLQEMETEWNKSKAADRLDTERWKSGYRSERTKELHEAREKHKKTWDLISDGLRIRPVVESVLEESRRRRGDKEDGAESK